MHRVRAYAEGGRHEFEQMVASLVDTLYGPAHVVQAAPGDWGIDVFVGDLTGRVQIWQVKYFIDGVGPGQMSNVRKSFTRACQAAAENGYRIEKWTLCVPVSLDGPTGQSWERWKVKQQHLTGVDIVLCDETPLRNLLMQPETAGIRRAYYDPYAETPTRPSLARLRIRPDDDVLDLADPDAGTWRGGAELRAGNTHYLLHDPIVESVGPDRSWVLRDAAARELEPRARVVRLRQLQISRATPDARNRWAGLRTQADLLVELAGAAGLPRLLVRHGLDSADGDEPERAGQALLVMSAPAGRTWRDVHGGQTDALGGQRGRRGEHGPLGQRHDRAPSRGHPDRLATAAVFAAAADLCRTLGALHRHGHAHRSLSPDNIVLTSPGRARAAVVPCDLGLAGMTELAGEGGPFSAPEQRRHQGGEPRRGRPGPGTDVYQVAALVLDALGGRPPSPASAGTLPPPPQPGLEGMLPGYPAQLDELLAVALDPDPARRPVIGALGAGLRAARRQLSLGGQP
ncbi:hypothetical protein [Frankia sp. QA3]|uniref:hypothetical protein n=1 Tax=Frankia sp. QA3 TaxID=710111 RepID=UPI00068643AD|nr:hypothetical protein [Frankia sp. QA3]